MSHYFAANIVTEASQKRSILLPAVGPTTSKLLRSLVGVEEITSKSCDELVEVLKTHYDPYLFRVINSTVELEPKEN